MTNPLDHLPPMASLPRGPGRPGRELHATYDRPLVQDDIVALATRPQTTTPKHSLKNLRAIHHNLARLLASGVSRNDVSAICGRSPQYIAILEGDPTFMELVAHYKSVVTEAYSDVHLQLAALNQDAISMLSEKMESDPDSLSVDHLMGIIKLTSDRTGHGPSKTVKTVDLTDKVLEQVKDVVQRERTGRVLSREDVADE